MFKNIFPDKLNGLVYRSGPEAPKGKEAPRDVFGRGAMTPEQYAAQMQNLLDRAVAKAPESAKEKQGREWIDNILHSSNSRKRFERLSASDAKDMVEGVGKEISRYMAGKTKDTLLNHTDGSTLLLERTAGGIVAVVVEGGTRVGGPKQAPVYITIGNVPNAYDKHLAMAEEFNKTPTAKKQNEVAVAFHKSPSGLARRLTERYVVSKES